MGYTIFMIEGRYFDIVEKIILVILLIATLAAISQEIIEVIKFKKLHLQIFCCYLYFLKLLG